MKILNVQTVDDLVEIRRLVNDGSFTGRIVQLQDGRSEHAWLQICSSEYKIVICPQDPATSRFGYSASPKAVEDAAKKNVEPALSIGLSVSEPTTNLIFELAKCFGPVVLRTVFPKMPDETDAQYDEKLKTRALTLDRSILNSIAKVKGTIYLDKKPEVPSALVKETNIKVPGENGKNEIKTMRAQFPITPDTFPKIESTYTVHFSARFMHFVIASNTAVYADRNLCPPCMPKFTVQWLNVEEEGLPDFPENWGLSPPTICGQTLRPLANCGILAIEAPKNSATAGGSGLLAIETTKGGAEEEGRANKNKRAADDAPEDAPEDKRAALEPVPLPGGAQNGASSLVESADVATARDELKAMD